MKQISFKNFRRFQNFPSVKLGEITIMVGRNNSGKSTMVKALLLIIDYLKNQQYQDFSFTGEILEDVNIITFGRALNRLSDTKEISFELIIENIVISIFISAADDDTIARVNKVLINDLKGYILIELNYQEGLLNIQKNRNMDTEEVKMDEALIEADLQIEKQDLEAETGKSNFKKFSAEGLRIIDRLNIINEKLTQLYEYKKRDTAKIEARLVEIDKSYPLKFNVYENMTEDSVIKELISDYFYQNNLAHREFLSERDNFDPDQEIQEFELHTIENSKNDVLRFIDKMVNDINSSHVFYLGANPTKQSALFSLRNKQNSLAQAIHDFHQLKILEGDVEHTFVRYWMKEFEVGDNFAIHFYAGEAYEFFVKNSDGTESHLADKGMGSLQAMMLILRVATILKKYNTKTQHITIIVEEPELNLHPALQSKLAMFFHKVNTDTGIKFIIETHSEYLIRKAQLFIAENEYTGAEGLNPNPFMIHYFDKDDGPYEMITHTNGKFDRNFGEGFYDEASKNAMALLKNAKNKD